jgi:branched-subunit amino acid transport protein
VTTLWLAIIGAAVVSIAIKATAPTVLGERQLPGCATGVVALLAPTLLAAIVVVDVLGPHWTALNWPVVAGLVAVASAKLLRAPMIVAVVAGIATTALLRLAIS